MSQSLANDIVHIVFSTKARERFLYKKLRPELYAYISGIFKNKKWLYYQIGGFEDHMHICCSLPKTISISDFIKEIKISTSIWLKTQDTSLTNFHWQTGYGLFSISPSHIDSLCKYIINQEQHHATTSFKDEFLGLLCKYHVDYDEKYLWS